MNTSNERLWALIATLAKWLEPTVASSKMEPYQVIGVAAISIFMIIAVIVILFMGS